MIQAITLLVIAALVAIDQIIKVAVVNRFAAGRQHGYSFRPYPHPLCREHRCGVQLHAESDGFSDDFYGGCYSHVYFPAHDEEN